MEKERARIEVINKLDNYIENKLNNLSMHAFNRTTAMEALIKETQLVENINKFQVEQIENNLEKTSTLNKTEIEKISVDLEDNTVENNMVTQMISKEKVTSKQNQKDVNRN